MNKLIYYVFVISLSIITINGCCFPKQIQMELNFGGTSNCIMNMSKIGNVVVGIFGCPDMNINLTNTLACYKSDNTCIYPNTLPIDKQFLPKNNNNISLIILNTCSFLTYESSQSVIILTYVYLQIINNNIAIINKAYHGKYINWKCWWDTLLQENNLAFSYIV